MSETVDDTELAGENSEGADDGETPTATGGDDGPEPTDEDPERTVIRPGRNFEREYHLDAAEAGEFLIAVGESLRDGDQLTIVDDEWELAFPFGEPAALEIEFEGMDRPELEIELELPGRTDDRAPSVGRVD